MKLRFQVVTYHDGKRAFPAYRVLHAGEEFLFDKFIVDLSPDPEAAMAYYIKRALAAMNHG
jgi:hypothetical protein